MSVCDKDFKSDYEENEEMRFCHTTVCGWRPRNEDSHVALMNIGDGNSLFGIFDGHGEPDAAKWVSHHIQE